MDNDEKQEHEALSQWQITAYQHYERGPLWYILTGLIGGGLLITAFVTYNFLLAALVVMVGVVMVIQGGTHPPTIDIEISPLGIRRGSRFFPYPSIDHFWIVYEPPVKSLHLSIPRSMFPTIHIPIDGQDPVKLREILKKYIREDIERDSEPILDSISRILKI